MHHPRLPLGDPRRPSGGDGALLLRARTGWPHHLRSVTYRIGRLARVHATPLCTRVRTRARLSRIIVCAPCALVMCVASRRMGLSCGAPRVRHAASGVALPLRSAARPFTR